MKEIKIKKSHLYAGIIILVILVGGFFVFHNKNSASSNSVTSISYPQIGKSAPDASFTTINGKEIKLSDYKGKRVLLWFFATWCPTCAQGAKFLENNNGELNGLEIIAVKTYANAGYAGVSTKEFAQQNAPQSLNYNNWVWGDASKNAALTYNPKNYPDIYYLINKDGTVAKINGAPGATINDIVSFANG